MKNLKHITRVFAIQAMIFSLLQTSFIFSVQAAESKSDINSKDILGAANIALQTYGQFLGAKQSMIQQQIASQRNQQMMQQLSPSCRKTDGTPCYTVAGQFFPECPIPNSMSAMPQNVCSAASPDPSAISSMLTYESIAKSWVNYFDQMMNEASNSKTPFGLKCLQDKQKALDSQLTEMVNNLTRLQDLLNKDKETFKANNKKLLEDMKQSNDELMGSSGGNNLALKTKDFAKYFSQSCQSIIGEEAMAMGATRGLNGIMQDLSPVSKRAGDYSSNKAMIESDLRRDIEKIQKSINDGGLQDYFDGKITESSKFQSLVLATQKQSAEFKLAKDRIAKELSKIGYELPTMDKNFSVDFDEFLSGSQSYFKKQYINDCVTGADKSGTAISTDQVLGALQQKSTGSSGTARDKYKAALASILNSDAFIEDKLAQIKALENTYQDISITYNNSNSQRVTSTPYDLYMKTLAACESRYTQDDTFSASGKNGVSQKKKVERGQALLRDLKNLHDNFSSDLGSRVLDQVLSCNGEGKKAGSTCGDKNSFDSTQPTFCMAQANQCANEVQGCFAEATKHVETRKAKLESLAKTFNANAQALVTRSNDLYKAQTKAVMDMVKVVQARFPGTNFEIPAGMFISMPEMKKDTFGVDMVNDGNIAFMDDLPKKIDLLKKVFKDQQAAANDQIKQYIDKQSMAMNREKERWNSLAGECKSMIDTSSREIAKMNNENSKKQAEMDNKVRNFCRKYNALSSHPVGGCENAKKLSGEMDDVMSRVLPTVSTNINEFNGVCNAYGNTSDSTSASANTLDNCRTNPPTDAAGKKNCAALLEADTARIRAEAAAVAAGGAAPSGKKGALNLAAICGSGDGLDNGALVEKILGKLPIKEQKKFATAAKKESLVAALKTGDFSKAEGYDELDDEGAFQEIYNITGPLKGNDTACGKLLEIDKQPAAATTVKVDVEDLGKKLKSAQDALDTFNEKTEVGKRLKDKSTRMDSHVDAQNRNRIVNIAESARSEEDKKMLAAYIEDDDGMVKKLKLAQDVTDLEAQVKKANDAKKDGVQPTESKKEKIAAMLSMIKIASGKKTPVDALKGEELTRIGQQIESNSVCDAQASNNNMAKAFQGGLLPAGFDEAVLGRSK